MAATFVTDFGTAAVLSILFIEPTLWLPPFVAVSALLIVAVPHLQPWFFGRYGDRVTEPEIKWLFAVKVGAKVVGVYPCARAYLGRDAWFTTLLMSTGLTFGTI